MICGWVLAVRTLRSSLEHAERTISSFEVGRVVITGRCCVLLLSVAVIKCCLEIELATPHLSPL